MTDEELRRLRLVLMTISGVCAVFATVITLILEMRD